MRRIPYEILMTVLILVAEFVFGFTLGLVISALAAVILVAVSGVFWVGTNQRDIESHIWGLLIGAGINAMVGTYFIFNPPFVGWFYVVVSLVLLFLLVLSAIKAWNMAHSK